MIALGMGKLEEKLEVEGFVSRIWKAGIWYTAFLRTEFLQQYE